jgi:hypothetical protein
MRKALCYAHLEICRSCFFFLIMTLLEHAHIVLVLRDELALSMSLQVHGGTFSLDKLRVSPRSRERGDTNA